MKCDICKCTESYVKIHKHEVKIKNKIIKFDSERSFCKKGNNLIYDKELDNKATNKAIKEYNKIVGINPDKIKELRKKYKLTQEEFSKIIGCAKKTLISYEQGTSIPNDIYMVTIKTLIDNPEVINNMISSNLERFEDKEYETIKNKIDNYSNNLKQIIGNEKIELTDFNGYTELNKDKVYNLMLMLCEKGIFKTKLLKEMFYCDFLYYKNTGLSITGLEYARINYGPVPDSFEIILNYLETNNYIKYEITYNGNTETFKIIGNKQPNIKIFASEEIEQINNIKEYFKNYTVKEIVEKSHQEKGYIETDNSKLISYDYAFDIELD